ncbi:MAG: hypothetical protein AAFP90_23985 [Planctomycetota bacterium]
MRAPNSLPLYLYSVMDPIDIPKRLRITYPSPNDIGCQTELRPRIIDVESIRDLMREPLHPDTIRDAPMVARSRFLATAIDAETQETRRFYLGDRGADLFIGLYEPDGDKPVEIISDGYHASLADRMRLIRDLDALEDVDTSPLLVRVCAIDTPVLDAETVQQVETLPQHFPLRVA